MKKFLMTAVCMLAVLLFTGCKKDAAPEEEAGAVSEQAQDEAAEAADEAVDTLRD